MSDRLLTVAIPTYDRAKYLTETLEQLLPQLTPECRVLVLDNCSPTPAAESQRAVVERFPGRDVTIRRNRVNIGGSPNLLRCLEEADTEWVWTLGDDEKVRPDAVATILGAIRANPDATFINFMLPWLGTRAAQRTRGWDEFVRCYHHDSLTLLSLNVYNRPRIAAHFRWAYLMATSMLSHVAILCPALGADGVVALRPEAVIDGYADHEVAKQVWPIVTHGIGRANIIDMPMSYATRKLLITKLDANFAIHPNVTMRLVVKATQDRDSRDALYLYDMFCYRNFYFDRRPKTRLRIHAFRQLVRFPRLGRGVIGWHFRGKPDWFQRTLTNESLDRL